jgi:hypothetical protein
VDASPELRGKLDALLGAAAATIEHAGSA